MKEVEEEEEEEEDGEEEDDNDGNGEREEGGGKEREADQGGLRGRMKTGRDLDNDDFDDYMCVILINTW